MIQLRINGSLINFGHIPARDVNITEIELTTPPSHFIIRMEKGQGILIGNYLWDLVQRMDETGVVIFNETIMAKNDVNKYEEK